MRITASFSLGILLINLLAVPSDQSRECHRKKYIREKMEISLKKFPKGTLPFYCQLINSITDLTKYDPYRACLKNATMQYIPLKPDMMLNPDYNKEMTPLLLGRKDMVIHMADCFDKITNCDQVNDIYLCIKS